MFSVHSLVKVLTLQKFNGLDDYPADVIWRTHVPTKVCGFIWQVTHEKILTVDNLMRRGFQLPNRCILCSVEAESIRHLFVDCQFVSQIWALLSSRLSLFGPFPGTMLGLVAAWKGLRWEREFDVCGKSLLHAILWCVWLERNSRTFRDEFASWEVVLGRVGRMVGEWSGTDGLMSESCRRRWMSIFRSQREPD
ncbi:hypothetical protein LINPERPRIM_LOCUS26640 [Linum perenne]